MRKPWMRGLTSYKFNAEGTMLAEKATEHRHANSRDALRNQVGRYADALGIDTAEARKRIIEQAHRLGRMPPR